MAILASSIYDGETLDARLEPGGRSEAGFDDSTWASVILLPWDLRTLSSPLGPPVRRTARFAPVAITRSPSGKVLVDFGQNLVGRLAIAVQGLAGQAVTLRHAEVLENGDLNIAVYLSRSPNISTVIIGGELHVPTLSFTGLLAQKAMELFSGRANYLHNLSDHRCLCACC